MRRLTTWEQVERMRKQWPRFRVLDRSRTAVTWTGDLRPLCQTYAVRVEYRRDLARLRVTVVNPLLRRRHEAPDKSIPHVYWNEKRRELPFLCLYDPVAREWHPGRAIAWTIIPWTIDWLACYEGWLATGEWTGGGRHPVAEQS